MRPFKLHYSCQIRIKKSEKRFEIQTNNKTKQTGHSISLNQRVEEGYEEEKTQFNICTGLDTNVTKYLEDRFFSSWAILAMRKCLMK